MEIRIKNEDELPEAASRLLTYATNERIFLFEGEMGTGKTTFIKSICKQLGSKDPASSPTYSIVNEYDYPGGKIYHLDFFRIKSDIEAFDIGFEEYLSSGNYCFIEWPEKVRRLWPLHYTKVLLKTDGHQGRLVRAHKV